jgi:hypothetical protein
VLGYCEATGCKGPIIGYDTGMLLHLVRHNEPN